MTGNFTPVQELLLELVVPDLSNFKVIADLNDYVGIISSHNLFLFQLKAYIAPGAKRNIIEANPDL